MRGMLWALVAALGLAGCATPRADRAWTPYLAEVASAEVAEDSFTIAPVSDWTYTRETRTPGRMAAASFAKADLVRVWFVLEPQPGSQIAAHTLLLFEFTGDRLLGLTVEARREEGERYSALRGALYAYELSYVWATARDLLTGRAVNLGHEVFVYPVEISPERLDALLERALARTQSLAARPRWYNTLFSNCTNELAKAAGLRWNHAFVLTGLSDEYLHREGIIPGRSFGEAKAAADATAFIVSLNGAPSESFDRALLQELRRRLTPLP